MDLPIQPNRIHWLILATVLAGVTITAAVLLRGQVTPTEPSQSQGPFNEPGIFWSVASVSHTLFPGTSATATANFQSQHDLRNVDVLVSTPLAGVVSVSPTNFPEILREQSYTVTITLVAPPAFEKKEFAGTVHLRKPSQDRGPEGIVEQRLPVVFRTEFSVLLAPTLPFSFNYPPTWIAELGVVAQDSGVDVKPPDDDLGDEGITVTRQAGDLALALADLNSQMFLVSEEMETFQGITWRILVHREQDTNVEFLTALTERNGSIYYLSAKNYPQLLPILLGIARSFNFGITP